jgi:hypothetical protein
MSENQKKILEMLAAGKISVDEAQRLLSLVDSGKQDEPTGGTIKGEGKTVARYLYVSVEPKPGSESTVYNLGPVNARGKVHIRVPLSLIRAGIKLATLVPPEVADKVNGAMREKGINFDVHHIKDEDIERLISGLIDTEINVESGFETVRVYVE